MAVVLLLAACSDSDSGSRADSTDTTQGESTADRDEAADAELLSGSDGGSGSIPHGLQPTDVGRDLIFTAEVELVVDDVDAAAAESLQAIEAVGGLL
jgi:hypothetical protein